MRSFFVLSMAAIWLCGLAQGETYMVRPDGTGDYPTFTIVREMTDCEGVTDVSRTTGLRAS